MAAATALSSGRLATDAGSRPEPSAAAILLSSGAATVGCDPIAAATPLSSGPPSARSAAWGGLAVELVGETFVSDRQHEHDGGGRHERDQSHEGDQPVRPELAAELELGMRDV